MFVQTQETSNQFHAAVSLEKPIVSQLFKKFAEAVLRLWLLD
jgi:hypothetical protein